MMIGTGVQITILKLKFITKRHQCLHRLILLNPRAYQILRAPQLAGPPVEDDAALSILVLNRSRRPPIPPKYVVVRDSTFITRQSS